MRIVGFLSFEREIARIIRNSEYESCRVQGHLAEEPKAFVRRPLRSDRQDTNSVIEIHAGISFPLPSARRVLDYLPGLLNWRIKSQATAIQHQTSSLKIQRHTARDLEANSCQRLAALSRQLSCLLKLVRTFFTFYSISFHPIFSLINFAFDRYSSGSGRERENK